MSRRLVQATLLVLVFTTFTINHVYGGVTDEELQADLLLVSAQDSIEKGDYQDAVSQLEKIYQMDINHPPALRYFYANALSEIGKYKKAHSECSRYIKQEGRSGEYYKDCLRLINSNQKLLTKSLTNEVNRFEEIIDEIKYETSMADGIDDLDDQFIYAGRSERHIRPEVIRGYFNIEKIEMYSSYMKLNSINDPMLSAEHGVNGLLILKASEFKAKDPRRGMVFRSKNEAIAHIMSFDGLFSPNVKLSYKCIDLVVKDLEYYVWEEPERGLLEKEKCTLTFNNVKGIVYYISKNKSNIDALLYMADQRDNTINNAENIEWKTGLSVNVVSDNSYSFQELMDIHSKITYMISE